MLAYRSIKNNNGGNTKGVNGHTIRHIQNMSSQELIRYVRNRLTRYKPHKVRRVEIPKENGKTRPLGIPSIEDRLIQQCIKQIMEPICEAKFHKHSYGFRPNRRTEHAVGRFLALANMFGLHYCVDIDIKGFFDNVNHSKLLKQIWSLGIRDKNLLCVIKKILKAEIEGIGVPTKGTPQGGILSPLLANIVLNELDWWISNQWETINFKRSTVRYKSADVNKPYGQRTADAIKVKSNLKKMFIVRYADDFKIMCSNYDDARRVFIATKSWLNERLGLEVSEEKSKITNLRKNNSEFLGFKFKLKKKNGRLVIKSNVSEKAKKKIRKTLKSKIKDIAENTNSETVVKYNAAVLGIHNYYSVANNVSYDFREIGYSINRTLYNRLKRVFSKKGVTSKAFDKYYSNYKNGVVNVANVKIFPITGVKMRNPMCFSQEICDYTEKGRNLIYKKVGKISSNTIKWVMESTNKNNPTEFNDNRISLFVAQSGRCAVSGLNINPRNMEVHHIDMNRKNNEYKNLIIIHKSVHKLVHVVREDVIAKYLNELNLDDKGLKKLNKLRNKIGNSEVIIAK